MNSFIYTLKDKSSLFFIILGIVISYSLFPVNGLFQHLSLMFMFLVAMPNIYLSIFAEDIEKENVAHNIQKKTLIIVLVLIFCIVVSYFLTKNINFRNNYSLPLEVTEKFTHFVYYEIFIVLYISFVYEYFLVGFVLLTLKNYIGDYLAIIFQSLILIGMLYLSTSSLWISIPLIFFPPFAGFIGVKTKSFVYPAVALFIFMLVVDILYLNGIVS